MSWTEDTTKTNRAFSTIQELQCSPLTVPQQQRVATTHEVATPVSELKSHKLFVSSAGATNAYKFKKTINERMVNVTDVRFISCTMKYTEPATDALLHEIIFVKLKNFPSSTFTVSSKTTENFEYHMTISTNEYLTSGTVQKSIIYYPNDYKISVERRVNIKDLEVEVYYQDDSTGEFHLFEDLNAIAFEMELKF